MENFYQESGRAGRDQLPSRSLLYYGVDDRKKMVIYCVSRNQSLNFSSNNDSVDFNKNVAGVYPGKCCKKEATVSKLRGEFLKEVPI